MRQIRKTQTLDTLVNVSNLITTRGLLTYKEVMFLLWMHPQSVEITQESIQKLLEVIDKININGNIIDSLIIESYKYSPKSTFELVQNVEA